MRLEKGEEKIYLKRRQSEKGNGEITFNRLEVHLWAEGLKNHLSICRSRMKEPPCNQPKGLWKDTSERGGNSTWDPQDMMKESPLCWASGHVPPQAPLKSSPDRLSAGAGRLISMSVYQARMCGPGECMVHIQMAAAPPQLPKHCHIKKGGPCSQNLWSAKTFMRNLTIIQS